MRSIARVPLDALAIPVLAAAALSCGGGEPTNGARTPIDLKEEACGMLGPGVHATFDGNKKPPFDGDISVIQAPTTTPNYISNSLTSSNRKFIMILGGPVKAGRYGIGATPAYLAYHETGGTPAAVWSSTSGGDQYVEDCGGGKFAVWTYEALSPAPQSAASGTLMVAITVKLP